MLVHDMSFVHQRSSDTKWYIFYLFVGLAALISAVTVLIAQLSWRGWVAGVRAMLTIQVSRLNAGKPMPRSCIPLAQDLHALVREMEADRRMRDESQITWSPASLKTILHEHLSGDEIMIVSNRQPYIHNRRGQENRSAVTGQRTRVRTRTGDACLFGRVDRPRQRLGRPRGRG